MTVMKLYEVEITHRAVVLASSEDEAYSVADSKHREIESDALDAEISVCKQITQEKQLPDGWTPDCLPYDDGDTPQNEVIQFWLDSEPPEVVRDTKTIDMFAEGASQ